MAEFALGDAVLDTIVDLKGLTEGIDAAEQTGKKGFDRVGEVIGGALKAGVAAAAAAVVIAVGAIGTAALDVASQTAQASRDIQASLGATKEEADNLAQAALQVFGDNWYGSIEEATAAVVEIRKQLGDLGDEELKAVAGGVAAIGDNFDAEAPAIINAVKAIRDNFPGTTEQQALDLIAAGFQRGLNSSGDFLESIGEYSVQFGESGATADQFFSVMETGLQAGVLGTDKVADAFKESRIRITEMSDDVVNAFTAIGDGQAQALSMGGATRGIEALNLLRTKATEIGVAVPQELADSMLRGESDFASSYSSLVLGAVEAGSISVADAQQIAIGGLREMDNQIWQNTAGVAIFGTQWEDMGSAALLAVDPAKTSLDTLAGSTDSLNAKYGSLADMQEAMGRKALVALEPLGAKLLELGNNVMPIVEQGFDWLANDLPPLIDMTVAIIDQGVAIVQDLFQGPLGDSLSSTGEQFQGTFAAVQEIVKTTATLLMLILGGVTTFIRAHSTEIQTILTAAWNIIKTVIDTALGVIKGVVSLALAVLKGDWQGAWNALRDIVTTVLSGIKTIVQNAVTIVGTLLAGIWTGLADGASKALAGIGAAVSAAFQSAVESVRKALNDIIDAMNNAISGFNALPGPDLPKIPHLATGTSFFEGGMALVGERGPELAFLPRGSAVIPNRQTEALMSGSSASTAHVHITIDDAGASWLKKLIRVEAEQAFNDVARNASRRSIV